MLHSITTSTTSTTISNLSQLASNVNDSGHVYTENSANGIKLLNSKKSLDKKLSVDQSDDTFEKYTMSQFRFNLKTLKRAVSEYMIQIITKISDTKFMKDATNLENLYNFDFLFHCQNIKFVLNNMKEEIIALENYRIYHQIISYDIYRCSVKINMLSYENEWMSKLTRLLSQKLKLLTNYFRIAIAESKAYKSCYKLRQYNAISELSYSMDFDNDADIPNPKEYVPVTIEAIFGLSLEHIQYRQYDVLKSFVEVQLSKFLNAGIKDSLEVATLYTILGSVFEEQNMHNEAYEFYFQTLRIRHKQFEKNHDAIGVTLFRLANIEFKRLSYNEAVEIALLSLEIRSIHLKYFDVELGDLNSLLGNSYYHLQNWNDCIQFTNHALEIYLYTLESQDDEIIKCYLRIAKSYILLRDTQKSVQILTFICEEYHEWYITKNIEYVNVFGKINDSIQTNTTPIVIEQLISTYGKLENVLKKRIYELIVEFYAYNNQPHIVRLLHIWKNLDGHITHERVNSLIMKEYNQLFVLWSFYNESTSIDSSDSSNDDSTTISTLLTWSNDDDSSKLT